MNRILNLIPVSKGSLSGSPYLLAVFLLVSGFGCAKAVAAPQQVVSLEDETASKLLVEAVKPEYPPIARVNFIQGDVEVEITVNTKGKVAEAHVVRGEPILAASAIEAVRKWRYQPYVSPEGPVPFHAKVIVKFRMLSSTLTVRRRFPKHPDAYLEKQIRLPEVITRPEANSSDAEVKFKVLLNAKGEVLDAVPIEAKKAEAEMAEKKLRSWKFRPARWGAIPVPWYLIVDVPLVRALVGHGKESRR